jgi:hypothetical protein
VCRGTLPSTLRLLVPRGVRLALLLLLHERRSGWGTLSSVLRVLFPRGVRLALMLLHERRQGDASRVAGYVQQLPQTFDTPLHWSPAEWEALQYPHLVNEVGPLPVPHVQ